MALIKKGDVKDYFASRRRQGNQIRIVPPSQPSATGFSGNESAAAKPLEFNQDATTDHSSSAILLAPADDSNTLIVLQVERVRE